MSTPSKVKFLNEENIMLTLEQIKERLQHSNLKAVAQVTGLHYNTVYKLMTTDVVPSYVTVKALSDYLQSWK